MEIELKLKSSVKAQAIEEKPKEEPLKKETQKSDYTLEDLQKTFGELAKAGLKPKLKKLLGKHEVTKVSELPTEKYGIVMDELKALKGA